MPTTSGEKSILAPMILELPVRSGSTPPEGWEGAVASSCPKCGGPVWVHDRIREAFNRTNTIVLCKPCVEVERNRQAKS